jgi:hypothetical protein
MSCTSASLEFKSYREVIENKITELDMVIKFESITTLLQTSHGKWERVNR